MRPERLRIPFTPPRLSLASSAALRQPRLWLLAAVLALVLAVSSWGAAEAQSPRGTIENLRLTSPNAGELVINWDVPSQTPTDYRVVYAPADQRFPSYRDENTAEKGNAYPTVNTHTVADLPHGTEYKVLVRARYSDGNPRGGPWSDQATITISSPPEPTPEPQRDATPVPKAPTATIAASNAAITEGANAVFTVTLKPAPSSDVRVTYNVAVSGDYGVSAASSRTVTVNSGATITLATTDDSIDEADGSVTVALATGTGYTVGTSASASVTVNDNDDPTATIAANSAAITEGANAVFTVTLSRAQASDVSVNYNLALGGDYGVATPDSLTATVSSGSTTAAITFATNDDDDDELNGGVTVLLAPGAGYAVGAANSATVTVKDDDEPRTAASHQGGTPHEPRSVGLSRNDKNNELVVSWQAPDATTAVTQWRIECNTDNSAWGASTGVGYSPLANGDLAFEADARYTYTCTGLDTKTRYYGRVRAINGGASGDWAEASSHLATNSVATIRASINPITEGATAVFTVTLSPAPGAATDVKVEVQSRTGDFGIAIASGANAHTVSVGTGGTGTLRLNTTDDNMPEPDGGVTVRIHPAPTGWAKGNPNRIDLRIKNRATDYDTDDNGLIEVSNLAQLNAIRMDPDGDGLVPDNPDTVDKREDLIYAVGFPNAVPGMGCPPTRCTGYELTTNLDFGAVSVAGDGSVSQGSFSGTYWNSGEGWEPINRFTGTFDGKNKTIANLYVDREDDDRLGLFARLGDDTESPALGATIRNLSLTGASVTGDDSLGVLAGQSDGPTSISNITVSGSVTGSASSSDRIGVLVGRSSSDTSISDAAASGTASSGGDKVGGLVGSNGGKISASYSSAAVSGTENVGGLVGDNMGDIRGSYASGSLSSVDDVGEHSHFGGLVGQNNGDITASFAVGSVNVGGTSSDAGGLVGTNNQSGIIIASYATGAVSSASSAGGLVGSDVAQAVFGSGVTNSYWDTESSGQTTSAAGTGKTGAELRAPTAYTGIYANWNLDLDNDDDSHATGQDDPWDFGANHNYPTLKNAGGNQKGPGPVSGLTISSNAQGQPALSWTAPAAVGDGTLTGDYVGRYSSDGGATWTAFGPVTGTSHTITALSTSNAFTVQVWALSSGAAHAIGPRSSIDNIPVADYDGDDDGLIDVDSLAKLDAIRYDMNGDGSVDNSANEAAYSAAFPNPASGMGCPSGCTGYELTANLAFAAWDAANPYWNGGKGWRSIGGLENAGWNTGYNATFEGNNNTISNLFIDREYTQADTWAGYRVGLFGLATQTSVIRNLNLTGVNVSGDEEVGGLVGSTLGEVSNVSVTGSVTGANLDAGGVVGFLVKGSILSSSFNGTVSGRASHTGGLVGTNFVGTVRHSSASGTVSMTGNIAHNIGGLVGQNSGIIYASYATNNVNANGSLFVGGLVGENGGPYIRDHGTIVASYSTGDVHGRGDVGGLVGENYANILISYSTGAVHRHGAGISSGAVGGLVGYNAMEGSTPYYTITNSYWSTSDTGWTFGVGSDDRNNNNVLDDGETNTVIGRTTFQLTGPTVYGGIYSTWDDYDEDGNAGTEEPWCFGSSSDLPTLKDADGNCRP